MSQLRVLHITPNGNIGGRERQIFLLMRELSRLDYKIKNDIVFVNPQGPFYEACLNINTRVYSTAYKPFDPRFFRYFFRLFEEYDVINFWGITSYLFILSLLHTNVKIFTLTGPRLVFRKTFIDAIIDVVKFFINRKEYSVVGRPNYLSTFSKIDGVALGLIRIVRKEIFVCILKRCSTVITPSLYMKDIAIREYGVASNSVTVISNFISYDDVILTKDKNLIRKEFNIAPSTVLFGSACRFDARKRLDRIINTMTLLPPDKDIKAIIFGNGDKNEYTRLMGKIHSAKLQDRIILPGIRLDIYNYMNALDLFVLPSDLEGFGLVLLEALYLKIPTAVFADGGGALEVIKDGETGFVVNSEDELSNLVQSFHDKKRETSFLTENGYRHVVASFNTDKAALYNEVFMKTSIQ